MSEAPSLCGFDPITPGYVPEGYIMSATGWRDPRPIGLPLDLPPHLAPMWYKPLFITYSDGSSVIDLCEARRYDEAVPDMDSLAVNPDGSLSVIENNLGGGRNAYYVPETHTLYFFSGDKRTKVRIRASLPMEELVKIAASMV